MDPKFFAKKEGAQPSRKRRLGKRGLGLAPRMAALVSSSTACLALSAVVYLSAIPALMERSPVAAAVVDAGVEAAHVVQQAADSIAESVSGATANAQTSENSQAVATAISPAAATTQAASAQTAQSVENQSQANSASSANDGGSTSDSTSPDPTPAPEPDPDPTPGLDEETELYWRNYVVDSYNNLGSLLAEYNQRASEFSSLCYASYDERQAATKRCDSLERSLYGGYTHLTNSGIPDASRYLPYRNAQIIAHRDLICALDCIISAWDANLGYTDPTGHEDEFNAALAGQQTYLDEFSVYYPQGCPA